MVSQLSTQFNFPQTNEDWEVKVVDYLLVGRPTGSVTLASKADLLENIPKTLINKIHHIRIVKQTSSQLKNYGQKDIKHLKSHFKT